MYNVIERNDYLNQLISWKDHDVIKVITGIRRSGKSYLLKELFYGYLLKNGITKDQIIILDLESIEHEELRDYKKLYEYIKTKLVPNKKNYVILDEVQNVKDFEKVLSSLYLDKNIDIYITGSNSKMLSGELATLLTGRYIKIEVLPLSFLEYKSTLDSSIPVDKAFINYLKWGGFPYITALQPNDVLCHQYLDGIYNTLVKKDIIYINRIEDVLILEDIIKFIFSNIGSVISPNKISNTLTSKGRKTSRPTVEKYLSYLLDSFMCYKVNRYDLKGKRYLGSLEKYYVADIGLRNYLIGFKNSNYGHILENIIYLELKRRGYDIYIGKIDDLEVDFVVSTYDDVYYIQVAHTITEKEVFDREILPLLKINDHHRKIILTTDYPLNKTYNGIKIINVYDWLLKVEDF
ncbi:MAG: ATP-binding protein [Acholeplasmataceae bacterium]|jgi:predicted AAA+ superfamily ATPase